MTHHLKPTCEYVKPVADCHGNVSKATPVGRNQTVWSFKAKPNNAYSRKESPTTPGKEQKVY